MCIVSRVRAGKFPVVIPAYPWLLDADKVEIVLKGQLKCYQVSWARMCHIRLEDRDELAPHRRCCIEVALGQLASAVLVCWVAVSLGRWHRRTALAILLPSSSLIILAGPLPGRKMVPFLRVGRRRHSGAVAGCGPRQFAHLGGQVWGSAERHDFWGCSAVVWLVGCADCTALGSDACPG